MTLIIIYFLCRIVYVGEPPDYERRGLFVIDNSNNKLNVELTIDKEEMKTALTDNHSIITSYINTFIDDYPNINVVKTLKQLLFLYGQENGDIPAVEPILDQYATDGDRESRRNKNKGHCQNFFIHLEKALRFALKFFNSSTTNQDIRKFLEQKEITGPLALSKKMKEHYSDYDTDFFYTFLTKERYKHKFWRKTCGLIQ